MKKKNKIFLIGGRGMIGKALQNQLSFLSNLETFVLDRKEIDLSIKESQEYLKNIISNEKPQHIVILAATKRQDKDGKVIKQINNKISENISTAISNFDCHITYISSCAVYGEKNNILFGNEELELRPTSFYGEHKVESEEIYKEKVIPKNLLIIRPPLIYSPIEKNGYSPIGFWNDAILKGTIKIWGAGEELREFIIDIDAANIIIFLIMIHHNGIINLVSGKSFTYKKIVNEIINITHAKVNKLERNQAFVNHYFDNTKLYSIIGQYEFTSPLDFIKKMAFLKGIKKLI